MIWLMNEIFSLFRPSEIRFLLLTSHRGCSRLVRSGVAGKLRQKQSAVGMIAEPTAAQAAEFPILDLTI
jgi:hypothetical protein